MTRPRILIIDPDDASRAALAVGLEARGFETIDSASIGDASPRLRSTAPAAVIASARREDGPALVAAIRAAAGDAAIVVTVPLAGTERAVAALRAGADAHLVEPVHPEHAALLLDRSLEKRRLLRESELLRDQVRRRQALVGSSPEIQSLVELIRRAGPTRAPMLIQGESGTGRTLVAQAVHDASPRRGRPFVRVSCAGLSERLLEAELFGWEAGAFADADYRREGRIVAADGGTLLLHEVTQLSPALQVRLLRVLQSGELERAGGAETVRVDVRVVATSRRDLAAEVHAGRFRDDLYYRLNVVTFSLPPLRSRKTDVPALAEHFLEISAAARHKLVRRISAGALAALLTHEWPGNVRELEAVIDGAVAVCTGSEILPEHLSPVLLREADTSTASALIPGATLFEIEREAILRTLEQAGGSTARAADILGVSIRKVQYRLREYRAGQSTRRRRDAEEDAPRLRAVGDDS
ncbi:MAG TPA: sigma-54 dependent transcriptional regulator [Anaeromyxobacteraceae bacterium]|nr:sigma-54 dependent transcriptional regulator [Anaeromyxobacteraceae bacterium]